jgi:hypothetical protein
MLPPKRFPFLAFVSCTPTVFPSRYSNQTITDYSLTRFEQRDVGVYLKPRSHRVDIPAVVTLRSGSDRLASVAHLTSRLAPAHRSEARSGVRGSFVTVARSAGVRASAKQLRGLWAVLSNKRAAFARVHRFGRLERRVP